MKWLRKIIAEEVAKVEGRLNAERVLMTSYISTHTKTATNNLEVEVIKLLSGVEQQIADSLRVFEAKVVHEAAVVMADKNELIKDLHQKLSAAQDAAAKITHWKADSETVAADHSLKLVK